MGSVPKIAELLDAQPEMDGSATPEKPIWNPTAGIKTISRKDAAPHISVRTRSTRRGPPVIVVEPADSPPTDHLDLELRVTTRLVLPITAGLLEAAILDHQPKLVLCKHSLDSIDESFLDVCRSHGVEIYVLAQSVYGAFKPVRLRRFGGLPWLQLQRRARWSVDLRAKRWMDLLVTALIAPIALPLMLLIAMAVSCSGWPLYLQVRVGANGKPFRMIKFRTMLVDAEARTGPRLSHSGDERVTRVGRVLRRFRLDELPQLVNVVMGQMSLVGPRPERPEFVVELLKLPHYQLRHLIRPGLTGIAQLTGGYAATPEDKLRCDLLYLHYRSLRSDFKLLMLTAVELFRGFPRG